MKKAFRKIVSVITCISFCSAYAPANQLAVPGTGESEFVKILQDECIYGLTVFVPKEIKKGEGRVGLLPSGIRDIRAWAQEQNFHIRVLVESGAGKYSDAEDSEYKKAGAAIITGDEKVEKAYRESEIVVKVKEPLGSRSNEIGRNEFELMKPNQVWFTYFHLAGNKDMTEGLLKRKIVALALETITSDDPKNRFPCLSPMSIAAGREAILYSILFRFGATIENGVITIDNKIKEKIFRNFPETKELHEDFRFMFGNQNWFFPLKDEKVVVWGGGTSGMAAVDFALLAGAEHVTIVEKFLKKCAILENIYEEEILSKKIKIINSKDSNSILERLKKAGIIITATYREGDKPGKVVTKDILDAVDTDDRRTDIKKPRILNPIDIDQGSAVEFVNLKGEVDELKPLDHDNPACLDYYGNIVCPVANLPGLQNLISPITSRWLEEARLPYLKDLIAGMYGNTKDEESIRRGLRNVIERNPGMKSGINILMGDLTLTESRVAERFGFKHTPIDTSL